MLKVPNNLYVKKTEFKGYGVFSEIDIKAGDIIETCYCIKVGPDPSEEIMDYAFNYPQGKLLPEAELVLPLGFGCVYRRFRVDCSLNDKSILFARDQVPILTLSPYPHPRPTQNSSIFRF